MAANFSSDPTSASFSSALFPSQPLVPNVAAAAATFSTASTTCVKFVEADPDPTNNPAIVSLFAVIYANIFVLGLVGNLLIIFLTLRHQSLRTVQNIFILNLAISDVIVCLLSLPFTPVTNIYKNWLFGRPICHLLPLVQGVSIFVSTFSLSAIAIDRYNLVVKPHSQHLSIKGATSVAVVLWVLSVAVSIPYSYYMVLEEYPGYCGEFCSERWPSASARRGYALIVLTLQFLVPFTTMSYCYATIFSRLRERANSRLRKLDERSQLLNISGKPPKEAGVITETEVETGDDGGGAKGNTPKDTGRDTPVSTTTAARKQPVEAKMSTPLQDQQRINLLAQQRRVTTLLALQVLIFGLAWLPQNILSLLIEYDDSLLQSTSSGTNYSYLLSIIAHCIAMCTNVANPVLYAWLNPIFKRLFLQAFHRSRKEKSTSNGGGGGGGAGNGGGGGGGVTLAVTMDSPRKSRAVTADEVTIIGDASIVKGSVVRVSIT